MSVRLVTEPKQKGQYCLSVHLTGLIFETALSILTGLLQAGKGLCRLYFMLLIVNTHIEIIKGTLVTYILTSVVLAQNAAKRYVYIKIYRVKN